VTTTVARARTDTHGPLLRATAAVGLAGLAVVLLWSDAPFALTFDDAWYYGEIGRHLAEGHGSTFDTINPTNGYHPLWQAIATLPHLVGFDGLGAMRALLALQLGLWVAAVVVVVRMVERPPATLAAVVVLVAANPFVLRTVASGLESGVVVLVGALLLSRPLDRRAGVLLALAFLARTDAALLVAMAALWVWPDRGRLRPLLLPSAVTAAVYLVANQLAFGIPTQVSGDVKRLPLTLGRAAAMGAVLLVAAALTRRTKRIEPSERFPQVTSFVARTGWYAGFCVAMVGYYLILSEQVWLWYFAPVLLYGFALLLLGGADLLDGARQESLRSYRAVQAILLLPLAGGLVLQVGPFTDPHQRSIQEANRDAGRWMSEHLPDDAVVASWDAGVLGYFTDQPVVNLDGVVNSAEYHDAMRDGTRPALLAEQGVTHLANHGDLVDGDDPGARLLADEVFGPGAGAAMELVHVEPFTYSGSTNRGGAGGLRPMAVFVYELQVTSPSGVE
jgi:hypothetical protein